MASLAALPPDNDGDPWEGTTTLTLTSPRSSVTVRPVGPGDEALLARFGREGLSPASRGKFACYSWMGEGLVAELAAAIDASCARRDLHLVALDTTGPTHTCVGYVFLWGAGDAIPELGLAVADAWQGRGLGSRLLGLVARMGRAMGRPALELTTMQSNDRALGVYVRAGWECLGLIHNPLGCDVPAAFEGRATPTGIEVEKQCVLILDEARRGETLRVLGAKRERSVSLFPLPDAAEEEGGCGGEAKEEGSGRGDGGGGGGGGGGVPRHDSHDSSHKKMRSSVPDVIYALASIAGDEGCSRWCAQVVVVKEQSYSTAEAANAAAEKELLGPPVPELGFDGMPMEDEPAERYFEDDCRGTDTTGYILEYQGQRCCVIKLELASIKADSAAAAKLTDHVYCLLKVQTDMGRPWRPDMKWRTQAFVDPQSAANAAREWFLEQQKFADWEGDEDFRNFTDAYDPAAKTSDSDVVLHTGYGTFRVKKVVLP